MSLATELAAIVKGDIKTDVATREAYSRDASLFTIKPKLVVVPQDREDIRQLVQYVSEHSEKKLSITVRSGGTDMTGGPLTNSIVVDTSRHLNRIIDVTASSALVEPGVFYRDFEAAALKAGALLPSYPASRELCTIGGMVSNNSGGEKSLQYGKTDRYVQQLKVILRDGNEYTFGSLTPDELKQKRKLKNLEGDIYRELYALLQKNYRKIQAARPRVTKNSTGYALWDVWDKQRFDVTKLFVGAQGTLGIITEVALRLVAPRPQSRLLLLFLYDLAPLAQIVTTTLRYRPESFESYDDHTFRLVRYLLPGLAARLPVTQLASLGLHSLPQLGMVTRHGVPKLVLLAEFTGHDAAEVQVRTEAAKMALKQFPITTKLVESAGEAAAYWAIRRESFNLLRQHVAGKHTAPFIDDVCVRADQLPQFLPALNDIMGRYDLTYSIAGHVGDGNFHIIPLMDFNDPQTIPIIKKLGEEVFALVQRFDGSMSGEHNDGLIRSHYLPEMYGEDMYQLFVQTKAIFDPRNIFNPGKKVGSSWAKVRRYLQPPVE